MKNLAHFLSFVFSPLLVTTYGVAAAMWFSTLHYIPLAARFQVLAWVFVVTGVLPGLMIFLLNRLGVISDFGLNTRTERTIPYCIVCICYLTLSYLFNLWHMPGWMVLFMVGGAAAVVISVIVNAWWKISAHLAGMGGMIGLLLRIYAEGAEIPSTFAALLVVVVLTGAVGSARVYLERHTPGQVLAGAVNGALCVYIISGL